MISVFTMKKWACGPMKNGPHTFSQQSPSFFLSKDQHKCSHLSVENLILKTVICSNSKKERRRKTLKTSHLNCKSQLEGQTISAHNLLRELDA